MPLHHYLPASFLASFSQDTITLPRRNRYVFIGDKVNKRIFRARASRVAATNNLYVYSGLLSKPSLIEDVWAGYEKELPEAINKLIDGSLDAKNWIRILVPFAAALFVRGLDYQERFLERFKDIFDYETKDLYQHLSSKENINPARLMELQRLLGPVTVAKWSVVQKIGNESLITNDLGFAPFQNPWTMDLGIAIPLNQTFILTLSPVLEREIVRAHGNKWVPIIEYYQNQPDNHEQLNDALFRTARRFIFGSTRDVVQKYIDCLTCETTIKQTELIEPAFLGFLSGRWARAHEFTWHRLASALEEKPSTDDQSNFKINWDNLAKGWCPPVLFPTNLMEFPSALYREQVTIYAKFYDPEIYYILSSIIFYEQTNDYDFIIEECNNGLEIATKPEHKSTLHLARGSAYLDLHKYSEALIDFNYYIKYEPNSTIALCNRGVALMNLNYIKLALEDFNKAIEIDPSNGEAWLNRGLAYYFFSKKHYNGLHDLSKAFKIIPTKVFTCLTETLENAIGLKDHIELLKHRAILLTHLTQRV